jgi:ABC-2 type transport system permease protein
MVVPSMDMVRILYAEMRREAHYLRAYRLEFVGDLLLFGLGFVLLSGLFQIVAQGNYSTQQQTLSMLGFLLWRAADGCMLRLMGSAVEESQWGTLEQIWMGGVSPAIILIMRTVVFCLFWVVRVAILGVILALWVGVEGIGVSWLELLIIFVLSLGSAIGVAYLLIGFQLVHKQISSLMLAISTSLLFVTGALVPLTHVPMWERLALLLPLGPGIRFLQQSESHSLVGWDGLWLLGHTAIYLTLGFYALKRGQRRARQLGSLAHY